LSLLSCTGNPEVTYGREGRNLQKDEPRKKGRLELVECFFCGKKGHMIKDCRQRKRVLEERKKEDEKRKRTRRVPSDDSDEELNATGDGMPKRLCLIGKNYYWIGLDSGVSLNVITKEAAGRIGGKRLQVGTTIKVTEAVTCQNCNGVNAHITSYMMPSAPVDILLGTPFLEKYSKGHVLRISG